VRLGLLTALLADLMLFLTAVTRPAKIRTRGNSIHEPALCELVLGAWKRFRRRAGFHDLPLSCSISKRVAMEAMERDRAGDETRLGTVALIKLLKQFFKTLDGVMASSALLGSSAINREPASFRGVYMALWRRAIGGAGPPCCALSCPARLAEKVGRRGQLDTLSNYLKKAMGRVVCCVLPGFFRRV